MLLFAPALRGAAVLAGREPAYPTEQRGSPRASRREPRLPDHTQPPEEGFSAAPPPRIRPLAIGLLLHGDYLLFAEGHDAVKGETFYRALGGEIEFGEAAAAAVVREFSEELGRAVEVRAPLGVVENRFTLHGKPGHEVIFEFLVEFAPGEAPGDFAPLTADEGGYPFTAKWLPLAEVLAGGWRVYPEGVPERLAGWLNASFGAP